MKHHTLWVCAKKGDQGIIVVAAQQSELSATLSTLMPSISRIVRELLEATVLALVVFFVIQLSIQNFRVEGHSMTPTLETGEYLMVNKVPYLRVDMKRLARLIPFWDVDESEEQYLPFSHPPERGDVIVFRAPKKPARDFVKRVIGLPGERVEIKGGVVYINGVKLDEPYPASSDLTRSMPCIPQTAQSNCTLQGDQYFVLGDNRRSSNDSRDWGPVPQENIVGKVWFIYWPLSNLPLPFLSVPGAGR